MPAPAEPAATALLLATLGALLALSVLVSRASQRLSAPAALAFLALGMLAGSEGVGGIPFDDYAAAFRFGVVALVLILFDGGLHTPLAAVREAWRPAAVLATAGVAGTAAIVAVAAHGLGFAWPAALLVGAVVSSTDAAAVFSVLRGSGISLRRRVGATLELESGLNDPVAVILTVATTEYLVSPAAAPGWALALGVAREVAIGGAVGAAIGWAGGRLLARVRLPAGGLYPALTLALACLAFGAATLLHGSGFLAVYVAGVWLGNGVGAPAGPGALPYRAGLLRVHDALAWLSQIGMFLVLGLLAFPSRVLAEAPVGLALAAVLALAARPLVVALCLAPFRAYTARERGYVGWVGLRGAVPIILATYPVLAGAPGARRVFDVVFLVVVATTVMPGATVPWLTRRLGLEAPEPPAPPAVLEIESRQPLEGALLSFYVDEALAVAGAAMRDLPFPEGAAATLIVRGRQLVAPRGHTRLEPGDHVYVIVRPEDRAFVELMFGRPEEG